MKIWEFEIKSIADLYPFHDLLLEEGHYHGAKCVMRMITEKKFPARLTVNGNLSWRWTLGRGAAKAILPYGTFPHHINRYFTATQAVWALINIGTF